MQQVVKFNSVQPRNITNYIYAMFHHGLQAHPIHADMGTLFRVHSVIPVITVSGKRASTQSAVVSLISIGKPGKIDQEKLVRHRSAVHRWIIPAMIRERYRLATSSIPLAAIPGSGMKSRVGMDMGIPTFGYGQIPGYWVWVWV
jgi:hypothetical protein